MSRIFLIGYMGAGKSTLGRIAAKQLGLSFIDLDHFIEGRYHKTVPTIFQEKGEAYFRQIEHELLLEVAEFENVIISTGGGAPCFFNNMQFMKESGTVVYLKASPKALFSRLVVAKSQRPILMNKTDDELLAFIEENLAKRAACYEESTVVFDAEELETSQQVYQAADLLAALVKQYIAIS